MAALHRTFCQRSMLLLRARQWLLLPVIRSCRHQQRDRILLKPLALSSVITMPSIEESKSILEEPVSYSHVHLYVDRVEDLCVYKALEQQLNTFATKSEGHWTLEQKKKLWQSLLMPDEATATTTDRSYCPQNRDVVQQLLAGFGFRVTGARYSDDDDDSTRSVLVTSRDPAGVQILVTAATAPPPTTGTGPPSSTSAGMFGASEYLFT
jgi:hypothetical protein